MSIITSPLGKDEIREIDRKAIEDYEISGIILMENAGRNVAEEVLKMLSGTDSARVAIFVEKEIMVAMVLLLLATYITKEWTFLCT